jgi:ubiquinone/menaquinone biosynthesis C-methylase UbiE
MSVDTTIVGAFVAPTGAGTTRPDLRNDRMSERDRTREHVIATYRGSAGRYDLTNRLYYLLGVRQGAFRRRAVEALRLRPGDTVVEVGCGTGLNFPLVEETIGPAGRIIGVDVTDAMLARARRRVQVRGWRNVTVIEADAARFRFPAGVDAILSTYALSLVPECAEVVARGCAALAPGGRWVVLDTSLRAGPPGWLARALVRPFAGTDEWIARRPWEAIQAAMRTGLTDVAVTDLYLGCLFLAAGTRPCPCPCPGPRGLTPLPRARRPITRAVREPAYGRV